MKTLKERMNKIDKICHNINHTYNKLDIKKDSRIQKVLQQRDLNSKEQDQNQANQQITVGCIISKAQIKKKQDEVGEMKSVRQMAQLKQIQQQTAQIQQIQQINNMQLQKEDLQNQINELVKMKKKIQELETQQTEKKSNQCIINKDNQILPQILKLKQEKLALENDLIQLGSKLEQIQLQNQQKRELVNKRNWREEKKQFELEWQDLEFKESRIIVQSFEERMQTYLTEDCEEIQIIQNEQDIIDQLSKEVEELLVIKQQEDFNNNNNNNNNDDVDSDQLISQRRIGHVYTSPLQVIEEEIVDQSFQL